eukprot:9782985-Prorocentrum_lima.AAC.1
MTSSLVGSEMCIRDRQKPQGCRSRSISPSRGARSDEYEDDNDTVVVATVSYTHLTLPTICSV